MTLTATYGALNLNDGTTYRLLTETDTLSGAAHRIVSQSYGGVRPGGVVASVTPDLLSHTLKIGVQASDYGGLESALSTLKKALAIPRQRLVISATDTRYWIAIPGPVSVAYVGPAYAVVTVPMLIATPFQQAATPTAAVSTASLASTYDPTAGTSTTSVFAAYLAGLQPSAWWRFGDATGSTTAADASGNGNALAVTGSATFGATGAISGDTDTAVTLSGTGQYFSGPRAGCLTGDVFTFGIRVKRTRTATKEFLWDNVSVSQPQVYLDTDNLIYLAKGGAVIAKSSLAITDTAFHDVLITKNGATSKIYLDGANVTVAVVNSTIVTPSRTTTTYLAASNTAGNVFAGTLDEAFLIVGTALSATQASDEYQNGLGTSLNRYAVNVSMTASGDAPAPLHAILTNQAGSSTPNHWQLLNLTQPGNVRYLETYASVPASSALVFDGPREAALVFSLANVTGWWPFADSSGNITDFSSNSRDLIVDTTVTYLADGPDARPALEFNGTSQWIRNGTAAFGLTGDFTIGAWINADAVASRGIMGKGQSLAGYALGLNSSGQLVFSVGNGSTSRTVTGATTLSTQAWYLVLATFSQASGTLRVYVNDTLDGQQALGVFTPSASGNNFGIGVVTDVVGGITRWFDGRIASPFVLNVALTQAQITAIVQGGSLPYYAGVRLNPTGRRPYLDPNPVTTNTIQIAAYHQSTAPSVRAALMTRGRYA